MNYGFETLDLPATGLQGARTSGPDPLQIAALMRSGGRPSDRDFDSFLPRRLRAVSSRYWTPLAVIACAAKWFDELGVKTVVDVGSGSGKFCIAGAMMSRCRFIGVEQRRQLVAASRVMSKLYGVQDRVSFLHETFGERAPPRADAYYFFNPFGENRFANESCLDNSVELSEERFARDVWSASYWLTVARPLTLVLTYNGLGARLPRCYSLERVARGLPCALELWRKQARC